MLRPSVAHVPFDADQFARLRDALARGELSTPRARLSAPPDPLDPRHLVDLKAGARERLRARGEQALRDGKIAALILNGGMATRFGGVVKGVVPVVEDRRDLSFLAVKLAGVRASGSRAGGSVAAAIMHSFATESASADHLAAIDWAGLPAADRLAFIQSIMPRLAADAIPLIDLPGADELPDTTLYAAPGHGDTLRRVRDSGTLDVLRRRGVEHVLVSNVDNLGATLDPEVVGAHLQAVDDGAELSVEVVPREPGDAGGCVAAVDGRPVIVEGFRLPAGTDLSAYPTSTPTRCGSRPPPSRASTP
jgi:UTP--glucose-1-phosphate uridylyltransferase